MIKNKNKAPCDEGAVAIEGMIIMIFLIFFLTFLLSFGILLYQQWVVEFTAQDVSSRLGQSYAYPNTDPVMGYIHRDMKAALSPYRYLGSRLEYRNEVKGEKYAAWSLEQCSLVKPEGDPKIVVETVYDNFAQRHIVVDITVTYKIPLGGALKYFGLKDQLTYHATGRAMCLDVSDYIHSVNSANTLCGINFGSKALGAVNSVLGLINTINNAREAREGWEAWEAEGGAGQ